MKVTMTSQNTVLASRMQCLKNTKCVLAEEHCCEVVFSGFYVWYNPSLQLQLVSMKAKQVKNKQAQLVKTHVKNSLGKERIKEKQLKDN